MKPERPQFERADDNPDFGKEQSDASYQTNIKKQRQENEKQARIDKATEEFRKKLGMTPKKENDKESKEPQQPNMF